MSDFNAKEVERQLRRDISVEAALELAKQQHESGLAGWEAFVVAAKDLPNAATEWTYCMSLLEALRKLEDAGYYSFPMTGRLGETILAEQKRKLQTYGASAYRLSEKQLGVIAREFWWPLRGVGENQSEQKKGDSVVL